MTVQTRLWRLRSSSDMVRSVSILTIIELSTWWLILERKKSHRYELVPNT